MNSRDQKDRSLAQRPNRFAIMLLLVAVLLAGGYFAYRVYPIANAPQVSILQQTPINLPSLTPVPTCETAYRDPNPVAVENTCIGTSSWRVDLPFGPDHAIEAFAAPASVNAGTSVQLFVTTTAASYSFSIYRMGWYSGLGGRLVYSSGQLPGIDQPAPLIDPQTRMASAHNWQYPITVRVPKTWVSGIYIVKFISSDGYMRYTLFVVRNDRGSEPIMVTASLFTYQAYNQWGGASLYTGIDANGNLTADARAYEVSFDRPYKDHGGLMDFALYEYNTVRWLERQQYNVTYATDIETDQHPELLSRHQLILIPGHAEYWSTAMRQNITDARDHGISLAFFGANEMYWHVRLESSPLGLDRRVICYREDTLDPLARNDPSSATVRWRDQPLYQNESLVLGQQYSGILASPAPLVLASGATPFLRGTTLSSGTNLPGLVGGEFDSVDPTTASTFPTLSVLASSHVTCEVSPVCPNGVGMANATLYVASSGAKVFDAGTFYWAWGLDDDVIAPRVPQHQLMTQNFSTLNQNLIAYLLAPASH